MPIAYIPNDPDAGSGAPRLRQQARRPTRPGTRAGFTYSNAQPEAVAKPGTAQFLFWQAREAGIAALQAWEASAGTQKAWQGNRRKLAFLQDEGEDLNAFYDRASFSFFHQTAGTTTYWSGASTDVVAHEVGHGLLDAIRPDLWDVNFLEVGAFHEAFGDCMAILTALADGETRQKLLASAPTLRKKNFVEGTAENLSKGIAALFPGHNAAAPRRAFNGFKYQLPSTLPADGPPGALINEFHSFGMLFSGCFWDLIANLFAAGPGGEAGLQAAARQAGRLLAEGAKGALVTPRFLQSVGRAMVLADQASNQGRNRQSIGDAFGRHNILLGSNAMLAPTMALDGVAPAGATLAAATHRDLARRLGAPRARLATSRVDLFGTQALRVSRVRTVDLSSLAPALKGVVALAEDPVLVGASGKRAAVMGAMPSAGDTDSEVQDFVRALLARGRLELPARPGAKSALKRAGRPPAAASTPAPQRHHTTHEVRVVNGQPTLRRVRFACFCCA